MTSVLLPLTSLSSLHLIPCTFFCVAILNAKGWSLLFLGDLFMPRPLQAYCALWVLCPGGVSRHFLKTVMPRAEGRRKGLGPQLREPWL